MASKRPGPEVFKAAGNTFRSLYGSAASPLRKGTSESFTAETRHFAADSAEGLGHPSFLHLELGQSRKAHAVILFVDIGGFTKLSFALDQERLHQLVQALTVTAINVIHENGGHIGEFTGDGVMAYFGDGDEQGSISSALAALSLLFKTIKEIVNPELESQGQPTITVSGGMESGEVLWTRVGTEQVSQLKPIGEATFLAGKLSTRKYTLAWECKMGPSVADWLTEDYKERTQQYGPVSVAGVSYTRELSLFKWAKYATDYLLEQDTTESRIRKTSSLQLGGLAAAAITPLSTPTQHTPRKIKDQPFF